MLYFDKTAFKSVIFFFLYSALVCVSLFAFAVPLCGADYRHSKPPEHDEIGIVTGNSLDIWPGPGYEKLIEHVDSFGMELVELFCEQLSAELNVLKKSRGTHYEIVF